MWCRFFITPNRPGKTPDTEIFKGFIDHHYEFCSKKFEYFDKEVPDELAETYPNLQAILVYKGYQGLQKIIRALHPVTSVNIYLEAGFQPRAECMAKSAT